MHKGPLHAELKLSKNVFQDSNPEGSVIVKNVNIDEYVLGANNLYITLANDFKMSVINLILLICCVPFPMKGSISAGTFAVFIDMLSTVTDTSAVTRPDRASYKSSNLSCPSSFLICYSYWSSFLKK
jgi:hypothetical protein